ncbi:MAG: DUF4142 domain-containing protein [Ferruginibacter sp.]|nr:DUF4142 domain-containing protein [Ferruginibacter sp.]
MKTLKNMSLFCGMLVFSLFTSQTGYAQKDQKFTDPEIASIAVTANQIDVDYALIAQKKSKDKAILDFANTMKNDHLSVIDLCTKLAKKLGVTPKTNSMTKSLLEGAKTTTATLNKASGKAFNKAYIDNEVAYHEAVINAVETILIPQAQNAELKGLLVKVLPTLKTHLEHSKMVQKGLK